MDASSKSKFIEAVIINENGPHALINGHLLPLKDANYRPLRIIEHCLWMPPHGTTPKRYRWALRDALTRLQVTRDAKQPSKLTDALSALRKLQTTLDSNTFNKFIRGLN